VWTRVHPTHQSSRVQCPSAPGTMPYLVNGVMVEKRSIWRLSIISELLWKLLNSISYLYELARLPVQPPCVSKE
jgi:ABC-type anion transport system duplicated permease subunit